MTSNCRTRQLAPNYTPTSTWKSQSCERHAPMHDYHIHGVCSCHHGLLLWVLYVSVRLFYSSANTHDDFWVHNAEANGVTAMKARSSWEKGRYKNATWLLQQLSHSLFPYPFFPSCACNFKRSKEPEEVLCILIWRWFFRSHRGRLLTGSSAQWSPKAKVIIEVLPPAKGGRWKALNFLRARKNCLLPELRKTHEK